MSAEGKKKNGESGKRNAETKPFRLNGRRQDWYAHQVGATQVGSSLSGGSTFMRGLLGGVIAERCGYGPAIVTSEARAEHAMDRCTHEMLKA